MCGTSSKLVEQVHPAARYSNREADSSGDSELETLSRSLPRSFSAPTTQDQAEDEKKQRRPKTCLLSSSSPHSMNTLASGYVSFCLSMISLKSCLAASSPTPLRSTMESACFARIWTLRNHADGRSQPAEVRRAAHPEGTIVTPHAAANPPRRQAPTENGDMVQPGRSEHGNDSRPSEHSA